MTNESFKFSPELVPLVLAGEKTCTWRLWDEKQLPIGETVELIARPNLNVFGEAIITSTTPKTMGELTQADKTGHETFESDEQMYTVYSNYYEKEVNHTTPVTVYHFQLLM